MRRAFAFGAVALALVAGAARAQNAKQTCVDASERGQKLVDDRKLLQARNAFLECAQDSCPAAVRRDCQAQLEDLKKNVPSIIVRVKDKDGSDATGTVALDGASIGKLDGQNLELDPGTHKIRVELLDGRAYDRQLIVAAGERNREVAFDASSVVTSQAASTPVAEKPVATKWSTLKTVGLVSMIAGGSVMVVSVITEVLALTFDGNAKTLQSRSENAGTPCDLKATPPTGNSDCDNAISYHAQAIGTQTLSIGLLIGGGAALAAGIVMFVAGGNKPASTASVHVTPLVSPSFAGLGLGGTF